MATFERLTDARKWVQHTESAIREGRHFKTAASKKHTLSELLGKYRGVMTLKNLADRRHILEFWDSRLGAYSLADVGPTMIADARDSMKDGRAPATITKYLVTLSHAFTYAMRELQWIEDNPVSKVSKPALPPGRVRFLDDDERKRLLTACRNSSNKFLLPVVVLALSTGMRDAEIMNLHWKKPKVEPENGAWGVVDLAQSRIILHATKNGERRMIPLTGLAKSLVETLPRHVDTDLLFPSKVRRTLPDRTKAPIKPMDLRTPWEGVVQEAKLENFKFHDLRHSAASYLAMSGCTPSEIAAVLGHKTLQMVKRYAHLSEAHTAGVVARMNEKIFSYAQPLMATHME